MRRRPALLASTLMLLVLLSLLPAAAFPAPNLPRSAGPAGRPAGSLAPAWDSELRAFWVDAFHGGIKSPAQIAQLIADAHTANANTLIVQVRRRGDAYYNESVEPRADDTALDPAPFDPLASLIAAAHSADPPLQVYAWAVVFPVWVESGYSTTDPARHVYYRHGQGRAWDDPENWLSYLYTGVGDPVASVDLDPGHPDAARYTVDVCTYLVRHYDVDGLVLDYVRYLGRDYGYNAVSEQRFHAAYGGAGHPLWDDANWMAWRREQVTDVVRRIYLEALAVKPDLVLGAAAIAWGDGPGVWENSSAYSRVFQDWRAWLEEGIVDVALPMNYDHEHEFPQNQWFRNWVEWEKDHQYNRAVAPSPGAFLNYISGSLTQAAVVQAPSALGHYALGTAFYSYASTNLDPGQPNSVFYAALSQPSGYGTPPWPAWAAPPTLPWKTSPTAGHLAGWAIGPAGPLDRATVQVTGPVSRTLLTDANGFFGAVDLPPGDYTVALPAPASSPLYATVAAGRVALATVASPGATPALRAVLVDAAHDGFKTPDQVDVLLADARAAHLNAVVVQMRRYGQVYYSTPYEPPADDAELAPGFDPLSYLLQQAHAGPQPLDVYAWLPLLPVWNQGTPPSAPAHVFNQHPEWLTSDVNGNQRSSGEYFLDPGHPGALTYVVGLAQDLLNRYPVDGLLFDGLYYPYENSTVGSPIWGYNPTSVQRFHARYGGSGNPAPGDPLWMQWRRDQATALARQLYLRCTELRPRLRLAAVAVDWGDSPDYTGGWENSSAYGRVLQDWRSWLAEGVVDLAAPANYDREYQPDQRTWYDHWLAWEQGNRGRRGILVLQGSYLNYPEGTLAQAGRIPGNAAGFSSYILTNLYANPDGNAAPQPPRQPWYYLPEAEWWLWRSLALPYGYTDPTNGLFTVTAPLYPGAVPTPTLEWKDVPTRGHAVGLALGPAVLDSVTVTLSGPEPRLLTSDGSGFFGAVDLPPGNYLAEVAGTDPAHRFLVGTVRAGHVTWLQPCLPLEGVAVSGPAALPIGRPGLFSASPQPPTATLPITYTWDNGTAGPTAVYSWTTAGTYTISVTALNRCGASSATVSVTVFCQPLLTATAAGPLALLVGQEGRYSGAVEPITASLPITFTWDNGTVGPTATYSWTATGTYTLSITATNVCNQQRGSLAVRVLTEWPYHVYLPLVVR